LIFFQKNFVIIIKLSENQRIENNKIFMLIRHHLKILRIFAAELVSKLNE